MKAIINGKRYDTKTAELIHEWSNGKYTNDFGYREKVLYRTKAGSWFLYHCGGALTDMAKSAGSNSTTGSESIETVTPDEAFRFLCEYGGEDTAEEWFGDKIQEA